MARKNPTNNILGVAHGPEPQSLIWNSEQGIFCFLLTQPFVKDSSMTVGKYLGNAKVTAYVRVSVS